jgi:hypothetical protein
MDIFAFMVKALKKGFDHYLLRGFYVLKGREGKQEGGLDCYCDGKVIGSIKDDNKDGEWIQTEKLLIGYMPPDRSTLAFCKLAKDDPLRVPIFWALWRKNGTSSLSLKFEGGWATCEDDVAERLGIVLTEPATYSRIDTKRLR